ncbi:class I SAM-dependent methyltransferase [Streptomyces djakartensis]|uniref:SAM-dependent methyltransferase n=1 Tax=Streptomyces djakartensis TaxID=68193 RepID=A0ABQ3A9E6_9ACTN|nr:class I SAM-dependent methyltransferase [Streptomyces djakartensis]GGY37587.1 SAM-dependent methyltransferase [Streptomyces djakartensis]
MELFGRTDDFGDTGSGGRGESYVVAQRSTRTRARGINQLVDLVTGNSRAASRILVDLLGGDGLVSRVVALTGRDDAVIATCDASPFMVEQAWASGIPALRQRAESLLFRDESVGGVLLAYGSHHIPVAERGTVAEEAFRVLQPGGIFVLHDFLTDSPVDVWFRKVVDVYAATGHDYPHFERDEAVSCLGSAGFEDVVPVLMDDSFVVSGATKEQAELELGRYMADMYGLEKLYDELGAQDTHRRTFELVCDIFRYEDVAGAYREVQASFDESRSVWTVTMPREALVVSGRKPAAWS